MPILGIWASSIQSYSPVGSYDSLATVTLAADATISFAGIPAGYRHLQLRFKANNAASANYKIALRFNGDSGSNYNWHYLYGDGSSAAAGANDEYTAMRLTKLNYGSTYWTTGVIDILDYASTTKYKTGRALGGWDSNGSGTIELASGLWKSTSAITSIDIVPYSGNLLSGTTVALYGIK